jgi:hypothetical protein
LRLGEDTVLLSSVVSESYCGELPLEENEPLRLDPCDFQRPWVGCLVQPSPGGLDGTLSLLVLCGEVPSAEPQELALSDLFTLPAEPGILTSRVTFPTLLEGDESVGKAFADPPPPPPFTGDKTGDATVWPNSVSAHFLVSISSAVGCCHAKTAAASKEKTDGGGWAEAANPAATIGEIIRLEDVPGPNSDAEKSLLSELPSESTVARPPGEVDKERSEDSTLLLSWRRASSLPSEEKPSSSE